MKRKPYNLLISALFFTLSIITVTHAKDKTTDYKLPPGTVMSGGKYQTIDKKAFNAYYLELVRAENGLFNGSVITAIGQHVFEAKDGWLILSADKLTAVSDKEVALTIEKKEKRFKVDSSTKAVSNGKPIKLSDLKVGDMVTVGTKWDSDVALVITRGPILFGGDEQLNPKWLTAIGITPKP